MENRSEHWFHRFTHGVNRGVEIICMLSVAAIAVITILAFFSRYIMQAPIVGTDELALYLLVWITFLGAALSVKKNDMVALSLVTDRLSEKNYYRLQLFIQGIIFVFSILLLWLGSLWLMSSAVWEATSTSLELPLWIPMAIFPFTMLIMTLFSVEKIIHNGKALKNIDKGGEAG